MVPAGRAHLAGASSRSVRRQAVGRCSTTISRLAPVMACSPDSSWRAAAANGQTENFISRVRDRGVDARAMQKMILVMREVVRARKRHWVREATAISLSFDDRQGYNLVVFKCDMPLRHRGAEHLRENLQFARHGVLGCIDVVRGSSMQELAQDYAERTCSRIMEMVDLFATPLGDTEKDHAVCDRFRTATRSIVVDGALVKVAHWLKEHHLPNISVVCRDPAHMIRIACSEPLCRTGRFEQQHARLFTSRHALLKDVQFSECCSAAGLPGIGRAEGRGARW